MAVVAWLTLALVGGCPGPAGPDGPDDTAPPSAPAEDCANGQDDDADGLADCADPDCEGFGCPEDCSNGRDDDGDGLVDCADPGCSDPACPEDCDDGHDDDGDGYADCADPDCDGTGCPEDCRDGRDNDDDGLLDCEDGDCAASCTEDCDGTADLDGDGLVACFDDDCWSDPFCRVEAITLRGGRLQGQSRRRFEIWDEGGVHHVPWSRRSGERVISVSLATGTAQVRRPPDWTPEPCSWSVPFATVRIETAALSDSSGPTGSFVPAPFAATSFRPASDCSLRASFLPRHLEVVDGAGARPATWCFSHFAWGASWIRGDVGTDARSASRTRYATTCPEGWCLLEAEVVDREWTIPALSPGSPYPWSYRLGPSFVGW